MSETEHRGWSIRVIRQCPAPGFLRWTAVARKRAGDTIRMLNADGRTANQAIERAKERIDSGWIGR